MQGALSDEVLWASGPARYDGRRIVLREKHPGEAQRPIVMLIPQRASLAFQTVSPCARLP